MTKNSTQYYEQKDKETKKKMLDVFEGFLDNVEEPNRSMLKSLVIDYCEYCVWTEELKRDINKRGFLIEGKENPSIGIMHKMSSRKADYYAKIIRAFKDELTKEEANALESFLDA